MNTYTEEIQLPNAFVEETEASFNNRINRAKYRRSEFEDTSIFKLNGTNLVIGAEALRSGKPVRITGPDKYRKGVLDRMLVAALLKLIPDGYRNIIVACAHTTNAVSYIDKMADALKGVHKVVRDDGKEVKYTVRAFMPWDEPAGGLLRFFTTRSGYNQENVRPGQTVIICDIGGKVSSMYPAIVKPGMKVEIYWSQGQSFNFGIQDITAGLEGELRGLHSDIFTGRSIPEKMLQEALTSVIKVEGADRHYVSVRGNPMDVTTAVFNAVGPALSQIENVYINNLNSGIDASHIIVTGGGGGLLFKPLKNEVLKHDYVYLADEESTIHFANLRGGEYATSVWAEQNFDKLDRTIDGRVYKPLIVILDPGNTGLKAKLIGVKAGR